MTSLPTFLAFLHSNRVALLVYAVATESEDETEKGISREKVTSRTSI